MTTKVTSSVLADTAVTPGVYGGGVSATSAQIPVVNVDAQGRLTYAANVTITNTSVYANSGQLTANVATGVVAVGLATSGVIAGSYGSGTTTPIVTVDSFGRVTGVSTTLITGGSAGIGATTYTRTLFTVNATTVATPTFTVAYTVGYLQVYYNGVLLSASDITASSGTSITLGFTPRVGDLVDCFAYNIAQVATANNVSPVYTGGQGGAAGQVLYQSGASTTANTDVGTTGQLLASVGAGKPYWSAQSALSIATTQLTGSLAVASGGTGATTASGARTNLGLATVAATGAYSDLSGLPSLVASATTDTTSATNITSGTLPTARLSGSYTGITGVGTLAAGTIPGTLISSAVANATTATNGAKAWVNFNGTTGTRNASYNVDSVTVNATGDYTINFTSGALTSNPYGVAGMTRAAGASNSGYGASIAISGAHTPSAANVRVWTLLHQATSEAVYSHIVQHTDYINVVAFQ